MTQNRLPLYATLLTLPTLLIGVGTFYLLVQEQGRRQRDAKADLEFKAGFLALQVRNLIGTIQSDMIQLAREMEGDGLVEAIIAQRDGNPLIRNAFLIETRRGLVYPMAHTAVDQEELRFLQRYKRLFDNPLSWVSEKSETTSFQISQKIQVKSRAPAEHGWKTWFWEDGFYLLCWYKDQTGNKVWGFELEMTHLYSRLLPLLSGFTPTGDLAVYDHLGRVFFQTAAGELPIKTAQVQIPVSPTLPNWQVRAWPDESQVLTSGWFLPATSLLLVLVITAILLGGWALVRQSRRDALDAMRKTNFVSNISHELKTPLTTIRMYAELLGDGRVQDQNRQDEFLNVIIDESQRLTRLVNNVLEFGRLERGTRAFKMAPHNLKALVQAVELTQRPRMKELNIDLKLVLPERELFAQIDRDALDQVVLNLIDNAVKYGCPNQGDVIWLELKEGETGPQIWVRDGGPGIPHGLRDKVFEKFFRADASLTSSHAGSGIGLSIARLIVDHHQGSLSLEESETGCCFVINLPGIEPCGEEN